MSKRAYRNLVVIGVLFVVGGLAAATPLDDYVAKPDKSYRYEVVKTVSNELATVYVIDMVSQTWRTKEEVDRPQWRHWLTTNSEEKSEIWLQIRKKRSRRPGIFYEEAVTEAICFGWIDGKMMSVDGEAYVLRFSPRRRNSVWSKANRERAENLIAAGKMERQGFEAIEEAQANGRWASAYSSKHSPAVPADLEQALSRNLLAQRFFQGMSNSHRLM